MNISEFRQQHPEYNDMPDDLVASRLYERHRDVYSDMTQEQFKAKFLGTTAGTHSTGGSEAGPPGSSVPAIPGNVFMAVPRAAYGVGKNVVSDLANIPRGLVADPLAQVFQNRAATPEEEKRSFSGLAGLTGLVTAPGIAEAATMGAAKIGGPQLLQKILAGAGSGALLGGGDAAIRSGGQASAIPGGAAGGAVLGGALGGVLPGHRAAGPIPSEKGVAARSPLAPFISSVDERMAQAAPEGEAISGMVKKADDLGEVLAGEQKVALRRAGFHKMTREEDQQLHDVMQGLLKPEAATPRVQAIMAVLDPYRKGVIPRAREAGITAGFIENHFPQHVAPVEHMAKGKVREDMIRNLVNRKLAASPEDAAAAIDDFVAAHTKEVAGGRAAKVIADFNNISLEDATQKMRRGFRAPRTSKMGNLEYSREFNNPFYDPSPSRQMPRYIENVEHRIGEAGQMGPAGEKVQALVNNIGNDNARSAVERLSRVATGSLEPQDSQAGNVLRKAQAFSATKLGPLSALRNLTQTPTNSLLRSDVPSFLRGIGRAATKAGEETAVGSGATSEHSLHNVAHQVGADTGFVSKWLKSVGFSQSEAMNRRLAANIGYEYTKKMASRLAKNPGDKFAAAELKSLGLDPAKASSMTERDLLIGSKRFNDQTQFRSRPLDIPSWMSDNPYTGNMAQFKGFTSQQGRLLAKETLDRLRSGTPGDKARAVRNLAIIAAVFPAAGEVTNNINSFIQGRKRDTKGIERYLENLTQVGGTALGADILQSAKYGEGDQGGSIAKNVIGPTGATAAGIGQTIIDANNKGKLTDSGKRFLIRQLGGGVGSMLAPRLVPYKNERKKKSN